MKMVTPARKLLSMAEMVNILVELGHMNKVAKDKVLEHHTDHIRQAQDEARNAAVDHLEKLVPALRKGIVTEDV